VNFLTPDDNDMNNAAVSKNALTTALWVAALAVGLAVLAWQVWAGWSALRPQASLLADSEIAAATDEPLSALPQRITLDPRKVALGNLLFHDKRFSGDNSVACASCHVLTKGGVDGLPHSIGIGGRVGAVNAPTVLNSGLNFRQFWDGRAATLEQQIDGPVLHPDELGSNWTEIIAKLGRDPDYSRHFEALYPDGIQAANIKDAIATFERSLITPNSRFDRYLRGEDQALSQEEREGFRLFKNYGCVACHQGANVGGNMFARFGVMRDYFSDRGNTTRADLGRFNVTGDPLHKHVFRVPSLRNVARTAPYFHDGAAPTLESAVLLMGHYQLGVTIPPQDVALIVAFLRTLSGEYAPYRP
jgi:cytochrome c peroxidase